MVVGAVCSRIELLKRKETPLDRAPEITPSSHKENWG